MCNFNESSCGYYDHSQDGFLWYHSEEGHMSVANYPLHYTLPKSVEAVLLSESGVHVDHLSCYQFDLLFTTSGHAHADLEIWTVDEHDNEAMIWKIMGSNAVDHVTHQVDLHPGYFHLKFAFHTNDAKDFNIILKNAVIHNGGCDFNGMRTRLNEIITSSDFT